MHSKDMQKLIIKGSEQCVRNILLKIRWGLNLSSDADPTITSTPFCFNRMMYGSRGMVAGAVSKMKSKLSASACKTPNRNILIAS